MRDAFGGTRAEDVRKFYESIGEADRQTELFSDKLVEMLSTLPQIGDTAGNALENLADTAARLQAKVGVELLPTVKSAATALEDVLQAIEDNPGLVKAIATIGTLATTFISITSAAVAAKVAAKLLAPAIGLLTGPFGWVTLAVAGVTAAIAAWYVLTRSSEQEIAPLNDVLAENTKLIDRNREAKEANNLVELGANLTQLNKAESQLEGRIAGINKELKEAQDSLRGLDEEISRLESLDEAMGSYRTIGSDRFATPSLHDLTEQFIEQSEKVKDLSDQLKAAEAGLKALNDESEETKELTKDLKDASEAANDFYKAITGIDSKAALAAARDALEDVLTGSGGDNFKSRLNELIALERQLEELQKGQAALTEQAGRDAESQKRLGETEKARIDVHDRYIKSLQAALGVADDRGEFEEILRYAEGYTEKFGDASGSLGGFAQAMRSVIALAKGGIRSVDFGEALEAEQKKAGEKAEKAQKEAAKAQEEQATFLAEQLRKINVDREKADQADREKAEREKDDQLEKDLKRGQARTKALEGDAERLADREAALSEARNALRQVDLALADGADRKELASHQEVLAKKLESIQGYGSAYAEVLRKDIQAAYDQLTTDILGYDEDIAASQAQSTAVIEALSKSQTETQIEAAIEVARVEADLLRARGGEYEKLAEKIEKAISRALTRGARLATRELERSRREFRAFADDILSIFTDAFAIEGLLGDVLTIGLDRFSKTFESEIKGLSNALTEAFGDALPLVGVYAKFWAEGFLKGVQDVFDGAQLTPFQEEIQGLQLDDLEIDQLEKALELNLTNQARLIAAHGENAIRSTEVFQNLIATEQNIRAQLDAATTSLIDVVSGFLPGFGDERTELYQSIGAGLAQLGLNNEQLAVIIGQFADRSVGELEALNRQVDARLEKLEAPADATLAPLTRIAESTASTAQNTELSNAKLSDVIALYASDADAVERLIQAQKDTPLENWIDTRQGIIRLFSAEQMQAFAVGASNLIAFQEEQIRQQRRLDDPDFAFVDDLRLLLEAAEVPDAERLKFLEDISNALKADFTDQGSRNELISSLVSLFDKYQISAEARDTFTARFADLLPVWQDIQISTAAAAEYLSELREYLSSAGVPEDQIQSLISNFTDAFSDNQIDFYENQRLLEEINTTLKEAGQAEFGPDAFAESFASGFDGLLPVWTDIQVSSAESAQYLKDLREYLLSQGVPEDRVDALIAQFEDAFTDNSINFAEYQTLIDSLNKTLSEFDVELPADLSVPFEGVPEDVQIPFGGVPEGTEVGFGGVPEGTDIDFAGIPEGTDVDFGGVPEGTDVPFGGVPEGTDVDFAGIPEGTDIDFAGIPEGTDVPFGGIGDASVPFDGIGDVSVPIDVSGLPANPQPPSPPLSGGNEPPNPNPPSPPDKGAGGLGGRGVRPTPPAGTYGYDIPAYESPTEAAMLAELELLKQIGEADSHHAVEIRDALLGELQVRAAASGLEASVLEVRAPVDLSADAKRAMSLASANTTVKGGEHPHRRHDRREGQRVDRRDGAGSGVCERTDYEFCLDCGWCVGAVGFDADSGRNCQHLAIPKPIRRAPESDSAAGRIADVSGKIGDLHPYRLTGDRRWRCKVRCAAFSDYRLYRRACTWKWGGSNVGAVGWLQSG